MGPVISIYWVMAKYDKTMWWSMVQTMRIHLFFKEKVQKRNMASEILYTQYKWKNKICDNL